MEFDFETFLEYVNYALYVALPFVLKAIVDIRNIFDKIDKAKKPDSDGGTTVTGDEIADIIGDAGVVGKFVLNGIKKKFTKEAVKEFNE